MFVAFGRFTSGTPGAYRVRATVSSEKLYRVDRTVEGWRVEALDGTADDATVTQADVDRVTRGIRCMLVRGLASKLPAATPPGVIRM